MKSKILATAAILLFAAVARADWTLISADFTEQKSLTINTWDATEGLSATGESGKLLRMSTRDVVSLVSNSAKSPGTAGTWRLTLRNGDLLEGDPTGVSGQSLLFKTRELGAVTIPLKSVAALIDPKFTTASPESASDKDIVHLRNGDLIEGLLVSVAGDKVQIATAANDNATTDIEMKFVQRISFGGITPPRTLPPLSARITFSSGGVLTVPLDPKDAGFSWTINDLTIKDPGNQEHHLTADQIVRIDVAGGRVVYLTDLDPAKDEQTTFLGTPWPTQVNKSVLGQPLKVAKTTYTRGLGVHTRSILTFDLSGNFDTLKLRAGLDDSALPRGSADLSVVLDGKVLWRAKTMKAGTVSEPLALPVHDGRTLELRAEPPAGSSNLDVLGRVDWLDTALIRP